MNSRLAAAPVLLAAAILLAGCEASSTICEPGQEMECPCDHGIGKRSCNPDGSGWSACDCESACTPGQTRACECIGMGSHTQTCLPDGKGWSTCDCDPCGVCECDEDLQRFLCSVDEDCGEGQYCEAGCCIEFCTCTADSDCLSYGLGKGHRCILGLCKLFICSHSSQCDGNQICMAGTCADPPACDSVASVSIVTLPCAVRTGASRQFRAQALDADGKVVPGMRFRWTSSTPEVATIDELTGVATGGDLSGQTDIKAHLICYEQ